MQPESSRWPSYTRESEAFVYLLLAFAASDPRCYSSSSGSSTPNAIKNAIRVAVQAARAGLSQHIAAEFAQRQAVAQA